MLTRIPWIRLGTISPVMTRSPNRICAFKNARAHACAKASIAAFVNTVIPVIKKNIDGRKDRRIVLLANGSRKTNPTIAEKSNMIVTIESMKFGLSVIAAVPKNHLHGS